MEERERRLTADRRRQKTGRGSFVMDVCFRVQEETYTEREVCVRAPLKPCTINL